MFAAIATMIRQKSPLAPACGVPGTVWRGYNRWMNKAFVKESDNDDDEEAAALALAIPPGAKNYITPAGYQRIREELLQLIDVDRPEVVRIVHWAASNGDRSENGDYIYGKRRLREIDRRIRFLTKRMDLAAIVDPSVHHGRDQVIGQCHGFGSPGSSASLWPSRTKARIATEASTVPTKAASSIEASSLAAPSVSATPTPLVATSCAAITWSIARGPNQARKSASASVSRRTTAATMKWSAASTIFSCVARGNDRPFRLSDTAIRR